MLLQTACDLSGVDIDQPRFYRDILLQAGSERIEEVKAVHRTARKQNQQYWHQQEFSHVPNSSTKPPCGRAAPYISVVMAVALVAGIMAVSALMSAAAVMTLMAF